ncbi:MAG: RNA polymerase sigma factor, partial [bacterium]|nr:RNA polymerase sigma factor [bacterium]
KQVQDKIYGLALRMLYHPADAEDAAQEILLKVVTHLGTFRGDSAFLTWVYRVASNHLLTRRKQGSEKEALSFKEYELDLDLESAAQWRKTRSPGILNELFVEEVRISCLQGLLLCMDREHRLAFLLVDVFEVSSQEGAEILEITAAAFRKRLSRARRKMIDFLSNKCALVNPHNPCTCKYHTQTQMDTPRFEDPNILFSKHPCFIRHTENTSRNISEMDELNRIGTVYKQYTDFHAPGVLVENIKGILDSGKYQLL